MNAKNSSFHELALLPEGKDKIYFDAQEALHDLKHFLPAQAPLKDFIHHNTLHAFQNLKFQKGIRSASEIFGYKVSLTLEEYRSLYASQHIDKDILEKIIIQKKGVDLLPAWKEKVISKEYNIETLPRIGSLRSNWKRQYRIDLDSLVHPTLFRILCSYLDQGISMWNFPVWHQGFLVSIREMERNSFTSFFQNRKGQKHITGRNPRYQHVAQYSLRRQNPLQAISF